MTAKRDLFIEKYLATGSPTGFNATKAAKAAGYAHPRQAGSRLLSNVDVQAAIRARLDELQMTADEVLLGLADIARFNPLNHIDFDYEGRVAVDLARIQAAGLGACVKKIYYDKNGLMTVEFHDSLTARRLIGQHHKLFTQKHEIEMPDLEPLPDLLAKAIERVYGDASATE